LVATLTAIARDADLLVHEALAAHIVGAEMPHSLLLELFTRSGIGTMIHPVAPDPVALASPA